jgi:hypothetical protein
MQQRIYQSKTKLNFDNLKLINSTSITCDILIRASFIMTLQNMSYSKKCLNYLL